MLGALSLVSDRTVTIDFGAPVRLADLPALAGRVLAWWLAELKEMAPGWARAHLSEPPQIATLLVENSRWRVISDKAQVAAFELDPSLDDKGLADQILQAAPDFSLKRLNVVFSPACALRRRIELPMMAERELRSAVELQIDRLSPFKTDAVRLAVRVLESNVVDGKLTADVAIVPRAAIEPIEQRLASLGFSVAAIDIDGGNGDGMGFDLRASSESAAPRRVLLVNFALACGVALTWYMAAVSWDAARAREVEAWQARIAELRPLAQRSAALRQQLDAMTQPFAVARAHTPGLTLDVVSELTKLMPDSAHLTELRLSADAMDLTGVAGDAPGLIATLEASKLFKDVKFRSPVMRRPELGKDRFEISLRLERKLP